MCSDKNANDNNKKKTISYLPPHTYFGFYCIN